VPFGLKAFTAVTKDPVAVVAFEMFEFARAGIVFVNG
jgi:hypothetical protein